MCIHGCCFVVIVEILKEAPTPTLACKVALFCETTVNIHVAISDNINLPAHHLRHHLVSQGSSFPS